MKKSENFSTKQALDYFNFFRWYLFNIFLQKIYKDDLSYDHLFKLVGLLKQVEDSLLVLNESRWLEDTLEKIKDTG